MLAPRLFLISNFRLAGVKTDSFKKCLRKFFCCVRIATFAKKGVLIYMPTSKKEGIFFTILMCSLMVLGMSTYNLILHNSFSFMALLIGFFPGFIVALFLDVFVVGKVAKALARKLPIQSTNPLYMILAISTAMVIGMVLFMSFYGTIISYGFQKGMLAIYGLTILQNFIVALPLQLLFVGPVSRKALVTVRNTDLLSD